MNKRTIQSHQVMVALDHEIPDQAYGLILELGQSIEWYKVGPGLFVRAGTEIIEFLHKHKKKIFLDLKLLDIPEVVAGTIKQIGELGVQFTTVNCLGGRRMLEQAGASCRGTEVKLLGVTLLTSFPHDDVMGLGWTEPEEKLVLRMMSMALEARLAGIVCSPHDLKTVKSQLVPGFITATPAIRFADQEVFCDDQVRVASPWDAVEWGADFIIIGRPITQAREPRGVVRRLFS